jgi:hypothetical protein
MTKPLILVVFILIGCNLKLAAQKTDSSRVRIEMIEKAFENYKNYQIDKRSTKKMTSDRVRSSDQKAVIGSDYESAEAGVVAKTIIFVDPFEGLPAKRRVLIGATQYDSRIEVRNVDPKTAFGKTAVINSVSVGIVIDKDKLHQIPMMNINWTLVALWELLIIFAEVSHLLTSRCWAQEQLLSWARIG